MIREKFDNSIVNASIANINIAIATLTDVEFKYWMMSCEKYPDFHPSHFEGMEENFIETGTWDIFPSYEGILDKKLPRNKK